MAAVVNGDGARNMSKNAKRRAKKKQHRTEEDVKQTTAPIEPKKSIETHARDAVQSTDMELEPAIDEAMAEQFAHVLQRYQAPDTQDTDGQNKGEVMYSDDDMEEDQEAKNVIPLSKRRQRQMQRMSVAELKQLVHRPELVEWGDVAAADPIMLIHLRAIRNSVPVPSHWGSKREYLQAHRGSARKRYELPKNIADTGIATLRDAINMADTDKTLKAKTRERVQPKLGRMDIDYQKLHDAFFKFQTKPPMSGFGETYFEGKEFEARCRKRRPGDLSPALKEALSIPPLAPVPWLIAMQRHGPPPSYPHLKIPGLNAPIPKGAQWGFHPGGWGRPPLDDAGNPKYGDVFGEQEDSQAAQINGDQAQYQHWGELESDEDEESDEEDEEEEEQEEEEQEEEDEEDEQQEGLHAPSSQAIEIEGTQSTSGLATPSGMQSVAEGLETPAHIELRKNTKPTVPRPSGPPPQLYQVIPERKSDGTTQGFIGSERLYDFSNSDGKST
ncbi:hypothetical protein MYAM1_001832 [Malassezia yamatoensis]|uniref:PSP proline-rich domain-containing protein n=1 Tax=Malassezia yamatoensis TaxID=253288 RepID=A0AAJ5YRH3_9BASI|nr:hypothetical protein MYAM1_001832 [Malassezia yamatoensis]